MLHARLNAPVDFNDPISVVQIASSAKEASTLIAQQSEEIHNLNLEIMHLSDACDGLSEHNTESDLDNSTLSIKASQQAERVAELESTLQQLLDAEGVIRTSHNRRAIKEVLHNNQSDK